MDQPVDAIFAIEPEHVKKVLASKPGKKKKGRVDATTVQADMGVV